MAASFRGLLDDLRGAGQLVEIARPVDIRHIAALVDQSDKALLFTRVDGYDMPVVSGVVNDRDRLAIAMGCPFGEIEARLRDGLDRPAAPRTVNSGPVRGVLAEGADVDLYRLPVPLFSVLDGGPMITAGVTLARDPDGEHGLNAGVYRYLVKERALTGIDIVTPNNLRRFAEKALARGAALPISINVGTHPIELIAATYKAPLGASEIAIAGGMRGEGLALTPCRTVDIECIADAEIVLEAEILPTGWTRPRGQVRRVHPPDGRAALESSGSRQGGLDAARCGLLRPPHAVGRTSGPPVRFYEAAVRRVCREAGVQVTAVNITPGGCCHWHAVIAIQPHPGDGKNAVMAALSVADMKHVTVVEDDIDVFDPVDVEWAVATRVQADRDVTIVSNARSKPLDPSLKIEPGKVPTTAKMGIDATIADDVPRARFHRIAYAYADRVRLEDYLDGAALRPAAVAPGPAADPAALAGRIEADIAAAPAYFAELAERYAEQGFQAVARALGELHAKGRALAGRRGQVLPHRLDLRRRPACGVLELTSSPAGFMTRIG